MVSPEGRAFRDKALLLNLRYRWKIELARIPDDMLVAIYYEFAISEYYENNEERFLEFVQDYFGDL